MAENKQTYKQPQTEAKEGKLKQLIVVFIFVEI